MKVCRNTTMVSMNILLVSVLGVLVTLASRQRTTEVVVRDPQMQLANTTQHSITFVANEGQWDDCVAFMAHKPGMTAWLQKEGVTFQFERRRGRDKVEGVVMSIAFEGASDQVKVIGEQKRTAKYNFFIGDDFSKWHSGVSGYAKIKYHRLYEGIDLYFREDNDWLEYDLLLSQGADLSNVRVRCEGLTELRIDEKGILVMETEHGCITQKPPTAWYESFSGEKIPIACHFEIIDEKRYGFEVEENLDLALVIDPGLEWSTFLGGIAFDRVICMELDGSGNAIVSGETWSPNFPTTPGAYDPSHNGGNSDIFISCLSADGDSLLWSTFIGGSGRDEPYDLAVDNSDRATVVGVTMSADFPTTPGAFDTTRSGLLDAVIVRLNADGTGLVYSTYLGGSEEDWICTIDLNGSGEAYVGGYTSSFDFPTTPGTYDTTYNGFRDAFVVHVNTAGSDLLYSTFLGGSLIEGWPYDTILFSTRVMALALDVSGEIVVAGVTTSSDFPTTPGVYDTIINGAEDVFVTRINAVGNDIIYSTFLGGTGTDIAYAKDLVLSPSGVVTIAGGTYSIDFPATADAYDITYNGNYDAFIAQFDATASNLIYSTYLGGSGLDGVMAMVADAQGKIVITGICEQGFPTTTGAYDTTWNGLQDVFISRLSLDGNGLADLIYSTYLGTSEHDWATSIAYVEDSNFILAGQAQLGFPTTKGAYDTTFNGEPNDGFVCQFGVYVGIEENKTNEPLPSLVLGPVFPNPSYTQFNYNINLTQTSKVKVCVVDVTGRLIERLINAELPAGIHFFSWVAPKELANGIYFLKLEVADYTETEKLLLVR